MCTSFAVYNQDNIIYGMNFDTDEIDLKLRITSYNGKNIFYLSGLLDNIYRDIAGINSDGLFICTQAVEYSADSKPSCTQNDWMVFDIYDEALKTANSASEFTEILNNRGVAFPRNPLFPDLGLHTIIADKTGDAFILEEGTDANIISQMNNDFIIMTNFPNGNFKETTYDKVCGRGADRYICAYEYIEKDTLSFDVNEAFEVLRKTRVDNTLCSIVLEPLKNELYISFKINFNKRWKVSITDKTIQSLDGFLSNNKIHFSNEEILVKDLVSLYE